MRRWAWAGQRRDDFLAACVRRRTRLQRMAFESGGFFYKYNNLGDREGSVPVAFPPPLALAKAFSRSGCVRIFALFSRVMRQRLSTDLRARRPGSGLSGPIFSGPHDCADLVNSLQRAGNMVFSKSTPLRFDIGGTRRNRTTIELSPPFLA